jgi:hypothetical protein
MVVRRESGRRYSKIAETTFNDDEFAQAYAELGTVKPFRERVDDVVVSAKAFLAGRGIPGCVWLFRPQKTGEYSCTKPSDPLDRGGGYKLDNYVLKILGLNRDSFEHLAARVIVAADAMQRRAGEHALEAAFELGTLEILSRVYADESRQAKKRGRMDKSRGWAEYLADHLVDHGATDQHTAKAMIPKERSEFILDEDHGFYLAEERSKKTNTMVEMLIFIDPVTEKEVDKMTWENFEKRYLRKVLQNVGQQRR